eukprot:TRINITY_DN590_c0_g1_i1.p1 TRINITY_DN590_c0_g1~~TRINITY_DN590_c0_g1_i1.p1  ORF type:complete len:147 (-),score=0.03 TRINITY_DN590_c0_g1_i1:141-521(-)
MSLKSHEDWEYFDSDLRRVSSGHGIPALKAALPDNDCGFVFFRFQAENVGNTGAGIITEANIVLQWKGTASSAIKKVKNNGNLNAAMKQCPANKGFIEVLGKTNLSTDNIFDRWRPGSGSKVISDD